MEQSAAVLIFLVDLPVFTKLYCFLKYNFNFDRHDRFHFQREKFELTVKVLFPEDMIGRLKFIVTGLLMLLGNASVLESGSRRSKHPIFWSSRSKHKLQTSAWVQLFIQLFMFLATPTIEQRQPRSSSSYKKQARDLFGSPPKYTNWRALVSDVAETQYKRYHHRPTIIFCLFPLVKLHICLTKGT